MKSVDQIDGVIGLDITNQKSVIAFKKRELEYLENELSWLERCVDCDHVVEHKSSQHDWCKKM